MTNTQDTENEFLASLGPQASRAYSHSQRELDELMIIISRSPELPHDTMLISMQTARDLDKEWFEHGLFTATREAIQLRGLYVRHSTVHGLEAARFRAMAAQRWLSRNTSVIQRAMEAAPPSACSEIIQMLLFF